jgi:predicted Holliday junction resolvase-like endonuclease
VEVIHFVDVKSGSARLAAKQQEIKSVVQKGRVTFKVTGSGS